MKHPIRIDAKHRYWIPGATKELQVPGFSELCTAMGVTKPNPFHTAEGRDRGISVHKWFHFLASGKVPKALPDERIRGKVEGIKKFLLDTRFMLHAAEEPQYDTENRTACTPDAWGHIGVWPWLIDVKSGGKTKTHALQTACQTLALRANGFQPQKRGALYLKNGGYKLIEHTDRLDLDRWKDIAAGYHALDEAGREIFAATQRLSDDSADKFDAATVRAFAARSHYL